jgi:hypothetical protein
MIASVHLANVRPRAIPAVLATRLERSGLPGVRYARTAIAVPLSERLLPAPDLGRVALIAGWDDDSALDRFLAEHPLAQRLASGWHTRLQPMRVWGEWSGLPGLVEEPQPMDDDEPAAALTLGRLKLSNAAGFLRASARAEGLAVRDPAMVAGTALARPPRLVATFSLWRTTAAMRAYARGGPGPGHRDAARKHGRRPFHHESAFIRCRPYAARGHWGGSDPLAEATQTGRA